MLRVFIAGQWTELNKNGMIAFITNRSFIDSRELLTVSENRFEDEFDCDLYR